MREKKEFNFAQQWIEGLARETGGPKKWKTTSVLLVMVSILLIGAVGSAPWVWDYKLRKDITLVEQQISALGEITNQVKQLNTLKAQAEEQQKLLDLMKKSTREPGPILENLKETLPIGTVVNTFSLQENTLNISVTFPSPVDVARLWVSLRESEMFLEVDNQPVSLQDKVQTLNFSLKLK